MAIDLPDVPRLVQGERRMTHRIPPWVPAKVHRWDQTLVVHTVVCWIGSFISVVFAFATYLAGYGEQYEDHPGWFAFWTLAAFALFVWPLVRSIAVRNARVVMGARMAKLVDIGAISWTRLTPADQEASDTVVRQLFAAANRHDRTAVRERVIALVELERTGVVSARGADGRMILDDVQYTIKGRHAVNGED